MEQPGGSTHIRSEADAAAAASVARHADARRTENIAAAALVHEVHVLGEIRFGAEMDVHFIGSDHPDHQPDVARARTATECDAAVALSLSRTVTREMVIVAAALADRLPGIDAAFTVGDLDYPRVRTIALTLQRASDATATALEPDILAAALRCNSRALTDNIWRLWIEHDPDEAAAARERAVSDQRCADIRRGTDGLATLISKMTTLEGAECEAILTELAATVCPKDPRTARQLQGYALLALFHREDSVACTCGTDTCPVASAPDFTPARRTPLINIHIDLDTLLGLNDHPATLADGTVLGADTARLIARDARWQALLTDLIDAAQQHATNNSGEASETCSSASSETTTGTSSPEPRPPTSDDSNTDDGPEPGDGHDDAGDGGIPTPPPAPPAPPTPPPPAPPTGRGRIRPRARRIIARGRTRPAAPLPSIAKKDRRTIQPSSRANSRLGEEAALTKAITEFLAAAATDPTLAGGHHPDGHGGLTLPPPGALTYRPSATLVALVRATYFHCTFPGCSVPAARCDIDHIVPFNHHNPTAGGWTILANLHPLCSYHHHAKTLQLWACAKLDGNGIYWRSGAGLHRITAATYGTVTVPDDFQHTRRYRPSTPPTPGATPNSTHIDPATGVSADGTTYITYDIDIDFDADADPDGADARETTAEPPDELYEPTWWETNITDQDTEWHELLRHNTEGGAPTLADIARLTDPRDRADAHYLRTRFLEHRAIVAEREKHRPPPF